MNTDDWVMDLDEGSAGIISVVISGHQWSSVVISVLSGNNLWLRFLVL